MSKIKLFVMNEPAPLQGVEAWRMFWPLDLLERTYSDHIQITYSRGNIFPSEFFQYDIFWCARPMEPSHSHVIRTARSHGKPVIIDFDDNFIEVPYGHGDFKALANSGLHVKESLSLANAVWVTTPALKEAYSKFNPNTSIIPNAILPELLPNEPTGNNGFMLWRGASAHMEDLWTWRREYEDYIKRLKQFLFIGYMPTWAAIEGKTTINFLTWVETQVWFQTLQNLKPCAIWKPLMNAAINDAKSNISYLEATIAGGLCVTNYAGRPGWEHAWRELPRKESDFVDGWKRAADDVRENYDLRKWNEFRFREILKLVNG